MDSHAKERRAEAPQAPVPGGDPKMPEEGQAPERGKPRTAPENPVPDRERIEMASEDLDRVGK